jgi:hypothetical protein
VFAVAAGSAVLGAVTTIAANVSYPLFAPWALFVATLKFSVPALAIFLFYAARAVSGHSRSHRDLLLAGVLALSGFILSGYGVAGLYNGMSDFALPEAHRALVLDKQTLRSKNSTSYHLYAQSWKAGRGVEDLTTESAVYQRVVPGKDRAVVYTKPGKLGFEWRVSFKV